ncbi:hypothetical protein SNEBB_003533 [Seison nebaliae]|nr:hypothetical protein SNEBB_003533 [Seison nebaliae]
MNDDPSTIHTTSDTCEDTQMKLIPSQSTSSTNSTTSSSLHHKNKFKRNRKYLEDEWRMPYIVTFVGRFYKRYNLPLIDIDLLEDELLKDEEHEDKSIFIANLLVKMLKGLRLGNSRIESPTLCNYVNTIVYLMARRYDKVYSINDPSKKLNKIQIKDNVPVKKNDDDGNEMVTEVKENENKEIQNLVKEENVKNDCSKEKRRKLKEEPEESISNEIAEKIELKEELIECAQSNSGEEEQPPQTIKEEIDNEMNSDELKKTISPKQTKNEKIIKLGRKDDVCFDERIPLKKKTGTDRSRKSLPISFNGERRVSSRLKKLQESKQIEKKVKNTTIEKGKKKMKVNSKKKKKKKIDIVIVEKEIEVRTDLLLTYNHISHSLSIFNSDWNTTRIIYEEQMKCCRDCGKISWYELSLEKKVKCLYEICEMLFTKVSSSTDTDQSVNEKFQIEPIMIDSSWSYYWYFGGTRLYYQQFIPPETPIYDNDLAENGTTSILKRRPPPFNYLKRTWRCCCRTMKDWNDLDDRLLSSSKKSDHKLHEFLQHNFLNLLPDFFQKQKQFLRERRMKKLKKLKKVQNELLLEAEKLRKEKEEMEIRKSQPEEVTKEEFIEQQRTEFKKLHREQRKLLRDVKSLTFSPNANVEEIVSEMKALVFVYMTRRLRSFSYIVKTLIKFSFTFPNTELFHYPVDVVRYPYYPDYVSKPMDLTTMKKKADEDKYKSIRDLLDDFDQITENSRNFNGKFNNITRQAMMMAREIKKIIDALHMNNDSIKEIQSYLYDTYKICTNISDGLIEFIDNEQFEKNKKSENQQNNNDEYNDILFSTYGRAMKKRNYNRYPSNSRYDDEDSDEGKRRRKKKSIEPTTSVGRRKKRNFESYVRSSFASDFYESSPRVLPRRKVVNESMKKISEQLKDDSSSDEEMSKEQKKKIKNGYLEDDADYNEETEEIETNLEEEDDEDFVEFDEASSENDDDDDFDIRKKRSENRVQKKNFFNITDNEESTSEEEEEEENGEQINPIYTNHNDNLYMSRSNLPIKNRQDSGDTISSEENSDVEMKNDTMEKNRQTEMNSNEEKINDNSLVDPIEMSGTLKNFNPTYSAINLQN